MNMLSLGYPSMNVTETRGLSSISFTTRCSIKSWIRGYVRQLLLSHNIKLSTTQHYSSQWRVRSESFCTCQLNHGRAGDNTVPTDVLSPVHQPPPIAKYWWAATLWVASLCHLWQLHWIRIFLSKTFDPPKSGPRATKKWNFYTSTGRLTCNLPQAYASLSDKE